MAAGQSRPDAFLDDIDTVIAGLDLSTKRIDSKTIEIFKSEGVQFRKHNAGKLQLHTRIDQKTQDALDALMDRTGQDKHMVIQVAIRFTLAKLMRAEGQLRDDQRSKARALARSGT